MLLNLHGIILRGTREPARIASLASFCPEAAHGELYRRALGRSVDRMSHSQIAKSRPKVQAWAAQQRIGLTFLKTHAGRFLENKTPAVSPEATAGAVYLVRNPLDIAVSFAHHMDWSIDEAIESINTPGLMMEKHDNVAQEVVGGWTENVESWTASVNDGVLVVRYEDAVSDPFKVMDHLARHIGLKADPLQIGLAVEFSSFGRLQADEVRHGFAERPSAAGRFFRVGRPGQWREALTTSQVDRLVKANERTMERFGYLP